MRLFLQYAASGIATGCAFALVATGFVAIYRVTRVVNFAQGVFAVLAGMLAYTLLAWGVPHILAEAIAIVAAGLAGALVGLVAIGRRGTSPLASLIITLGLGIDVRRMGLLAFGLGGGLGGLAGVLLTPLQPVAFNSDVGIAISGFAAAIFGGLLRPGAALAGALVLGVAEALVAGYGQASLQSGVALVIMLGIMIWRAGRRPLSADEDAA